MLESLRPSILKGRTGKIKESIYIHFVPQQNPYKVEKPVWNRRSYVWRSVQTETEERSRTSSLMWVALFFLVVIPTSTDTRLVCTVKFYWHTPKFYPTINLYIEIFLMILCLFEIPIICFPVNHLSAYIHSASPNFLTFYEHFKPVLFYYVYLKYCCHCFNLKRVFGLWGKFP